MEDLLVISNHINWSEEQKRGWGNIEYISFPNIDSRFNTEELVNFCIEWINKNKDVINEYKNICLQGEMSFTLVFVRQLEKQEKVYWFPTTERIVVETVNADGSVQKNSIFKFVLWRKV